ncbi:MAG: hypothetical protein QHH24_02990 [Candidatus Bathyarchaeota archaeon]|nr:hypothetical protein [Candidatus Bathyarchaeota archaeon]
MKEETAEHVNYAIRVFKLIIVPLSLIYLATNLLLFETNVLGATLWGLLTFFYSNFLPDLPSIYRRIRKKQKGEDLKWYRKYALLLFAPVLVWILFSGMKLNWETVDTFHNFKSLTVYGIFLFVLSFFSFAKFPVSLGTVIEIIAVPLYGVIGYLAHLKVDKVW